MPVVDWGTKIAPEVQSALAADPNIKWVLPIYDSMSIPAIAGIRGAGKATSVKVASYNGTPDVMKLIENGDIMAADMGENIELARIREHGPGDADPRPTGRSSRTATRTRRCASSTTATSRRPDAPEYVKGFGDSYITGYKKLWGVQ